MDLNNMDDLKKQAPTLAAIGKVNPFILPDGYFEGLQQNLNSRINLEVFKGREDFIVPDGYFEYLPQYTQSRIFTEGLKPAGLEDGFTAPDNYFENLSEQINSRIFVNELKGNRTTEDFTVPDGYFNDLEKRISGRLEVKKPATKIISIRSWVQYAAAACITIAIGTGVYLNDMQTHAVANAQEAIASIPDEDIISYLQLHSDAADTPVILENLDKESNKLPDISDELSDEELQQYINGTL